MPPVQIGEVMRGGTALRRRAVEQSGISQPGDVVSGIVGWQEYAVLRRRAEIAKRHVSAATAFT